MVKFTAWEGVGERRLGVAPQRHHVAPQIR
jgi:hypothetical protein